MKKTLSLFAVLIFTAFTFAQKTLASDPMHSRIQFVVTHLGINEITGNFDTSNLTIEANEKSFVNSKITFEVVTSSINTHVEPRDKHLKSADFFDVEKYPNMKFTSTSLKKIKANSYQLLGNLTMHGITKPVKLNLIYKGSTVNPMNKKPTYGYQVKGTLNRADFGVGPNFPATLISNEVKIKGDFELTAK